MPLDFSCCRSAQGSCCRGILFICFKGYRKNPRTQMTSPLKSRWQYCQDRENQQSEWFVRPVVTARMVWNWCGHYNFSAVIIITASNSEHKSIQSVRNCFYTKASELKTKSIKRQQKYSQSYLLKFSKTTHGCPKVVIKGVLNGVFNGPFNTVWTPHLDCHLHKCCIWLAITLCQCNTTWRPVWYCVF